jgi:prepilin-type N-terminal cleavage/methylation domain-containing protein
MKKSPGFTLIELVVATGLLALIMLVSTAIFTRTIAVQRRDIAQQALQEDVRFALELMTREIRTGYGSTYTMPQGTGTILFRNQANECAMYKLNNQTKQIERAATKSPSQECATSDFSNQSFTSIHSPDTTFEKVTFDSTRSEPQGPNNVPDRQGFITIMVKAVSRTNADVRLELQTSIISRQTTIFQPQ